MCVAGWLGKNHRFGSREKENEECVGHRRHRRCLVPLDRLFRVPPPPSPSPKHVLYRRALAPHVVVFYEDEDCSLLLWDLQNTKESKLKWSCLMFFIEQRTRHEGKKNTQDELNEKETDSKKTRMHCLGDDVRWDGMGHGHGSHAGRNLQGKPCVISRTESFLEVIL